MGIGRRGEEGGKAGHREAEVKKREEGAGNREAEL